MPFQTVPWTFAIDDGLLYMETIYLRSSRVTGWWPVQVEPTFEGGRLHHLDFGKGWSSFVKAAGYCSQSIVMITHIGGDQFDVD